MCVHSLLFVQLQFIPPVQIVVVVTEHAMLNLFVIALEGGTILQIALSVLVRLVLHGLLKLSQ